MDECLCSDLCSAETAALILRVSPESVHGLARSGKLSRVMLAGPGHVGKRIARYSISECEALAKQRRKREPFGRFGQDWMARVEAFRESSYIFDPVIARDVPVKTISQGLRMALRRNARRYSGVSVCQKDDRVWLIRPERLHEIADKLPPGLKAYLGAHMNTLGER